MQEPLGDDQGGGEKPTLGATDWYSKPRTHVAKLGEALLEGVWEGRRETRKMGGVGGAGEALW